MLAGILMTAVVIGIAITALVFVIDTHDDGEVLVGQQNADFQVSEDGCISVALTADGPDVSNYALNIRLDDRGGESRTVDLPLEDNQLVADTDKPAFFRETAQYGGPIVTGGQWKADTPMTVCLMQSKVSEGDKVTISVVNKNRDTVVQQETVRAGDVPSPEDEWEYASLVFKQEFHLYSEFTEREEDFSARVPLPDNQCMADDYSDVRFTQSYPDGTEEPLNYYIEEDNGQTVAWVVIDDFAAGEETTIQMYYGQQNSGTCQATQPVPEYTEDSPPSTDDAVLPEPEPIDEGQNTLSTKPSDAGSDGHVPVSTGGTYTSDDAETPYAGEASSGGDTLVERTEQSVRTEEHHQLSQPIVETPHLAGYWAMGEEASSQTARDEVGYNHGRNDGVKTGIRGLFSSPAYYFDGGSAVDLSDKPYHLDELTFSAWVRPEGDGEQTLAEFEDGTRIIADGASNEFVFEYTGGTVRAPYEEGKWTHLAATADATEMVLHVDGQRAAETSVSEAPSVRSGFVLGDSYEDIVLVSEDTPTWEGAIDEVVLYSTALDDSTLHATYEEATTETFYTEWREYGFEIDQSTLFLHEFDVDVYGQQMSITVQSDADPADGTVDQESTPVQVTDDTTRADVDGLTETAYRYRLKIEMSTDDPTESPVFRQATLSARNMGDRDLYASDGPLANYHTPDYETMVMEDTESVIARVTPSEVTADVDETVSFDGTDSEGNELVYHWDFTGDGITDAVGSTGEYAYSSKDYYSGSLTVEDADGETDSTSFAADIGTLVDDGGDEETEIGDWSATLDLDSTYEVGQDIDAAVVLDGVDDSQVTTYEWDMNNGDTYTTNTGSVSHYYTQSGSYTVSVTATAEDGSTETDTMTIDVIGDDATLVGNNLQAAIDDASSGDTLVVPDGTYDGVTVDKQLTLVAENDDATITGRSYITAENVSMDGIDLDARLDTEASGIRLTNADINSPGWGLVIKGDDTVVRNMHVTAGDGGAVTVQLSVKNTTLDETTGIATQAGRYGLRLREGGEATVTGGEYRSERDHALHTRGDNAAIELDGVTLSGAKKALSLRSTTDVTLGASNTVTRGHGTLRALSLAANPGEEIRLTDGHIENVDQGTAFDTPPLPLFDSYGYPIGDPGPKYRSEHVFTDDLLLRGVDKAVTDTLVIHGDNTTVTGIEVRANRNEYGIETLGNDITVSNVTIDNPHNWGIVGRANNLTVRDSVVSSTRGIHTNSGTEGLEVLNNEINSGRHGVRPRDDAFGIRIEGNTIDAGKHGVNAYPGVEATIQDNNISANADGIKTDSTGAFTIAGNTIDAGTHALPTAPASLSLGSNTIVNGEYLTALSIAASPGETIQLSPDTAENLDSGTTLDVQTDRFTAPTHLYTDDLTVSATDVTTDWMTIRGAGTTVRGLAIEPTANEYAVETLANDITLDTVTIDNSHNWAVVGRADGLTVKDSTVKGTRGIHTNPDSIGLTVRNNEISSGRHGVRPRDGATDILVENNDISASSNGVHLRDTNIGITIRGNTISAGGSAFRFPRGNDITLGDNTVTRGSKALLSHLDNAAGTGETLRAGDGQIYNPDQGYTIDIPHNEFGGTNLHTNGLTLEFVGETEVQNNDRDIEVFADDVTVVNANLQGKHGIEFHGRGGTLRDSHIDVSGWGVLIRSHENGVVDTHINARDGVHTNSDLMDVTVNRNLIITSDMGIRARSGTSGTAYDNHVHAGGTALQTASMDTSGNTVGPVDHGISASPSNPSTGESVSFSANLHDTIAVDEVRWKFGDGSEHAFGTSASHTYDLAGEMTVEVEVTDSYGNIYRDTHALTVDDMAASNRFDGTETVVSSGEDLNAALNNGDPGERFRVEAGTYDPVDVQVSDITVIGEEGAEITGGRSYINANGVTFENIEYSGGRIDVENSGFTLTDSRIENSGGWGLVIWANDVTADSNYIDAQRGIYTYTNRDNISLTDNAVHASGQYTVRIRSGTQATLSGNGLVGSTPVTAASGSDVAFDGDTLTATSDGHIVDASTQALDATDITVNRGRVLDVASRIAPTDDTLTLSDGAVTFDSGRTIRTHTDVYRGAAMYTSGLTVTGDGTARIEGGSYLYLKSSDMTVRDLTVNTRVEPEGTGATVSNLDIDNNNWGVVLRNSDATVEGLTIDGNDGVYVDPSAHRATIRDVTVSANRYGIRLRNGPSDVTVHNVDVTSSSREALRSEGSSGLSVTSSEFHTTRDHSVSLLGGSASIAGLTLESPQKAIAVNGNTDIAFDGSVTVREGDILSAADRGASSGDTLEVTSDTISNADSGYDISVPEQTHGPADLRTADLRVTTSGGAALSGLDIYGDGATLAGATVRPEGDSRIDVYADDVTIKHSDIETGQQWGVVVRNNRFTLESTDIDGRNGVYLDGGTSGHTLSGSTIVSDGRTIDLNSGVSGVTVEDSTVRSRTNRAVMSDGGSELLLDGVTVEGQPALALHANSDLSITTATIEGDASGSLSTILLAADTGTETVVSETGVENTGTGFSVTTSNGEYGTATIHNADHTVTFEQGATLNRLAVRGSGVTVNGGTIYSKNDHAVEVFASGAEFHDMEVHNKYKWAYVNRADQPTITGADIRAVRGIWANDNTADVFIDENELDTDEYGIYLKSGTTGMVSNNIIDSDSNPLQPADADTENNEIR